MLFEKDKILWFIIVKDVLKVLLTVINLGYTLSVVEMFNYCSYDLINLLDLVILDNLH